MADNLIMLDNLASAIILNVCKSAIFKFVLTNFKFALALSAIFQYVYLRVTFK